MHIISHFSTEVHQYGLLLQFYTKVSETLHKPLKNAYCQTNYIDAMSQIIKIHSRDYAFVMKELNL